MNVQIAGTISDVGKAAPPLGECAFTVHGVLPPPVTGMTACTKSMIDWMTQRMPVHSYNWSNGAKQLSLSFRLSKAVRAQLTPWKLLFSRRANQHAFYMPSNAGFPLYFNMLAIAAARLRGYRCALHHHIYAYLNRYDWRIQALDWLLGPNGIHLVLCPHMEQQLRRLYGCRASVAIVPSAIQLLQSTIADDVEVATPPTRSEDFCLGHLGNLSMAKGLDLAIDTHRALRRNNRKTRLILAGPICSQTEVRMIDEARREFGESVEYRGPVYQDAKRKFFEDIHAVLYPTRNDAQPLVITEAFAFGRPVLSYGQGCIPGMVGSRSEWSIPVEDDYTDRAVPQIEAWIDDSRAYEEACHFARRRYDELLALASRALEDFALWVGGKSPEGFVRPGSRSH
jgi:glycosyltransferase involved in cell wall biosynthesis